MRVSVNDCDGGMMKVLFVFALVFGWANGYYSCSILNPITPNKEPFKVIYEDDCYILDGGKEMKLISVKDLEDIL